MVFYFGGRVGWVCWYFCAGFLVVGLMGLCIFGFANGVICVVLCVWWVLFLWQQNSNMRKL